MHHGCNNRFLYFEAKFSTDMNQDKNLSFEYISFFELEALLLMSDSMLGTGGGSLSLGGTGGRSLEVLESFLEILDSIGWGSPLELLESFLEILESVE